MQIWKAWTARLSIVSLISSSLPLAPSAHAQEVLGVDPIQTLRSEFARIAVFSRTSGGAIKIESRNPRVLPIQYHYELRLLSDGFQFSVLEADEFGSADLVTALQIKRGDKDLQGISSAEAVQRVGQRIKGFLTSLQLKIELEQTRNRIASGTLRFEKASVAGDLLFGAGAVMVGLLLAGAYYKAQGWTRSWMFMLTSFSSLFLNMALSNYASATDLARLENRIALEQDALHASNLSEEQYLSEIKARTEALLAEPGLTQSAEFAETFGIVGTTVIVLLSEVLFKNLKTRNERIVAVGLLSLPFLLYLARTRFDERQAQMGLTSPKVLEDRFENRSPPRSTTSSRNSRPVANARFRTVSELTFDKRAGKSLDCAHI